MKSAIDTNVLLDLLAGDAPASEAAGGILAEATSAGPVVICPVVFTELAPGFENQTIAESFLHDLGIVVEDFSRASMWRAGEAWRTYTIRRDTQIQCPRCGHRLDLACPACQTRISWRQHVISDFLIGAHASTQADVLVTRDRGYYRSYFPQLPLDIPTTGSP